MGNYHARCGAGEKPEVETLEAYLSLFKMPANFDKILATCRSRGIYCVPILQSLAQIKKLFKDGAWEGIVGNCDTFVYLGGNEQSSHKYISELLGKWTIDKRTSGESKGTSGSASENYDVLGRELMDAPEVRKLPDSMEIIFVRGEDPIIDKKWYPWKNQIHKTARNCGDYEYDNHMETEAVEEMGNVERLNKESLDYYRKMEKKTPQGVRIYDISLAAFLQHDFMSEEQENIEEIMESLTDEEIEKSLSLEEEKEEQKALERFKAQYASLSLIEICASDVIEEERIEICKELIKAGIPEDKIKRIIHPDYTIDAAKTLMNTALSMYMTENK